MSFSFLNPSDVDKNMFFRCVKILSEKDGIELHMLNDAVLQEYDKTIIEFLSYLISVGEQLEEYETCSELILQQKRYKKWLTVNIETTKSISNLLKDLKFKEMKIYDLDVFTQNGFQTRPCLWYFDTKILDEMVGKYADYRRVRRV